LGEGQRVRELNGKQHIRKLTHTGNGSYYVVIPPEIIRNLKWKERQKLVVNRRGKSIIISDWAKKRP